MKKAIIDSSTAVGVGVSGSVVAHTLPPAVDAVTTYTHAIITLATVIGTLYPMFAGLFKRKQK